MYATHEFSDESEISADESPASDEEHGRRVIVIRKRRPMSRPTASGAPPAAPAAPLAVPAPLTDFARPLDLADDPAVALAVNDAHRRPDVRDGPAADLWSADQLAAVFPRQYRYPANTFAPRCWRGSVAVSQAEYTRRFAAEYPEVASILPIENVVVAGGAAAWPLGEMTSKTGDVDLFVHGIDPGDSAALWKKADQVARRLTAAYLANGARAVTHAMLPGILTLTVQEPWGRDRQRKAQVVLRAYPSVSGILHAFDVPASSVAFDGAVAYTTTLGAYAHVFRANVVNPAYRSTTYEARLSKYFDRGYALVLPHLRYGLLASGVTLQLPHLRLVVRAGRGPFASGMLELPAGTPAAGSDYGGESVRSRHTTDVDAHSAFNYNVAQLASGGGRYMLATTQYASDRRGRGLKLSHLLEGPSLQDVLPRAKLVSCLDRGATRVIDARGCINALALRRLYGMPDEAILRLVSVAVEVQRQQPSRRFDFAPALAPFREAVLQRYDSSPQAIQWWITQNPERQFTASIDPRIEDPAEWYGPEAVALGALHLSPQDHIEALVATLEMRQTGAENDDPVFDGLCLLCREPLVRGSANSIILPCGHIYHAAGSEDCSGLLSWFGEGNSSCPTCRRRYGDEHTERVVRDNGRVPVTVAW